MKSLIGGAGLAAAGAIVSFLGLTIALGWMGGSLFQAIPLAAVGLLMIGFGGYLQRPETPRGFAFCGLACLFTSFLVATEAPRLVPAGSGSDALQLWCLMAAGTMLFFGLASMIAAGFSYLLKKG